MRLKTNPPRLLYSKTEIKKAKKLLAKSTPFEDWAAAKCRSPCDLQTYKGILKQLSTIACSGDDNDVTNLK